MATRSSGWRAPGTLLLDKTGTITESRVALAAWEGPEWVKPLVLALEQESSHPIAAGFRRAFEGTRGSGRHAGRLT